MEKSGRILEIKEKKKKLQMMSFTGEHKCKLDSKNRIVLPAKIRRKLPEENCKKMYLRKGFENCITLYPYESYNKIIKKLEGFDVDFDTNQRIAYRNFIGGIEEIEIDDNYRFIIPKNMIEVTGIKKDITLIGLIDKIEIWDKDTWENEKIKDAETLKNLIEEEMKKVKNKE